MLTVSLTDEDECALNTDNCHADATCTNTVIGFTCDCNAGYTGDGVTSCTGKKIDTNKQSALY